MRNNDASQAQPARGFFNSPFVRGARDGWRDPVAVGTDEDFECEVMNDLYDWGFNVGQIARKTCIALGFCNVPRP